ncbi:MAG TPA: GNAT family N-acetyltransferase [Gaiellaceae bacterium]|nr:GNAT family N-acetyltransferase [Gaiellaceae bacterium]
MEIRRESYGSVTAQSLSASLAEELPVRHDGFDGSGGAPPRSDFESPEGAFLVVYEGGQPVACGGICRYDADTAELRRMFVIPGARGRGLARALLSALEDEARALGYVAVRLEAGKRQPDAIGLYRATGFEPIARYGPYVDDERSVCLEKRLRVFHRP